MRSYRTITISLLSRIGGSFTSAVPTSEIPFFGISNENSKSGRPVSDLDLDSDSGSDSDMYSMALLMELVFALFRAHDQITSHPRDIKCDIQHLVSYRIVSWPVSCVGVLSKK